MKEHKNIKMLIALLLLLVSTVALIGCDERDYDNKTPIKWERCGEWELGKPGDNFYLYYDVETKVIYACYAQGMTVILNADGTPKLYEEDKR